MKGVRWEEKRQKWRAYYKNSTLGYFDTEDEAIEARLSAEKDAAAAPPQIKEFYTQSDLAKALGVTRGAIAGRVNRGTLPPYDKEKTWRQETVTHLLEGES